MAARSFTGKPAGSRLPALGAPSGRLARLARLAISVLTLSLTACATPEQRAAQAQADMAQMMAVYGPACRHLGYAVQTDAWRACVLNLGAKYDLQRYANSPGYYGWGGGYSRFNGWGPYW